METIIVHPRNQKEQAAVEGILKALDIAYHKQEETLYDRDFVIQAKKNKGQSEDVWKLE
jgi:hypothetical protein